MQTMNAIMAVRWQRCHSTICQFASFLFGIIFMTLIELSKTDAAAVPTPVSVNVPSIGLITGLQYTIENSNKVDAFLGIPFAKPPIGSLRFQPPVRPDPPPSGVTRTVDATRLPNTCLQVVDTSFDKKYVDMWNPNTNMNEDCLYLNVWRPATGKTNQAVMVWIYGGGFSSGTSTLDIYDGKFLSSKGDIIVVSIQYRLGPLGFLAFGNSNWGVKGNAGLLDQQMALAWIHDNIAAFGGDPGRVTLFGESAGSASVSYHLLSPGSAALFRSGILMSATVTTDWNFVSRDDASNNARALARQVGCNSWLGDQALLQCLRNADGHALTASQWSVPVAGPKITSAFIPTVDGQFISRPPNELLKTGSFQKKDILIGSVKNEGFYFLIYLFPSVFDVTLPSIDLTNDVYLSVIRNMSALNVSKDFVVNSVAFEYARPCDDEDEDGPGWTSPYAAALDRLLGDALFACSVVNFARTYTTIGNRSVYVYSFNHRTSGNPWPTWTGATHGYEIDHVFGVPSQAEQRSNYTDDERALSDLAIAYWTNFAKTGDPNQGDNSTNATADLPVWPKYTISNRTVLVLDTGSKLTTENGLRERECDYWLNIVPQLEAAASGYQVQAVGVLWTLFASSLAIIMFA